MLDFQMNGYEIFDSFIKPDEILPVQQELEGVSLKATKGGIRNADKKFSSIRALVNSKKIIRKAQDYLSGKPSIVRVILFDKTPGNNWQVSWHQDKTIAVSDKVSMQGWGPWSVKEGIYHVQPPLKVLNDMVTFRIHIDCARKENGCLRVIPGSHQCGILSGEEIKVQVERQPLVDCEAGAGAVLVMRPHILHSSRKALDSSSRRVIHVEYCSTTLPGGINWI